MPDDQHPDPDADRLRVRVTADYRHPDGYLFWVGEELTPLWRDPASGGVEVKTVGDYV